MAEVDTNIGSKRRLPIWMLGVTTADQSKNEDENCTSLQEQSSVQTACSNAKPITRRLEHKVSTNEKVASEVNSGSHVHMHKAERCNTVGIIFQKRATPKKRKLTKYEPESREIEMNVLANENENGPPEVTSGTLVKCETRRRTGKKSRRDGDTETSITSSGEAGAQSKKAKTRCAEDKKTVQKRTAPKKQKLKNYGNESTKDISPSQTEGSEDGELTMEDLMSIAEEYVKASKKECQQTAMEEPNSKSQCLNSVIISKNESRGSLQATGNVRQLSTCTSTAGPSPDLVEKESLAIGVAITASRTGDPAQDMLDLLLGPLLKKPRAEERNLDLLREDMTIACNLNRDVIGGVGVEQEAPLRKKTSSLKDKVAMFLD